MFCLKVVLLLMIYSTKSCCCWCQGQAQTPPPVVVRCFKITEIKGPKNNGTTCTVSRKLACSVIRRTEICSLCLRPPLAHILQMRTAMVCRLFGSLAWYIAVRIYVFLYARRVSLIFEVRYFLSNWWKTVRFMEKAQSIKTLLFCTDWIRPKSLRRNV